MTSDGGRHRLAVVLGGGGWFGIGYNLGVLDGLRRGGVDVTGVPLLGTSAGSWAAALTVTGIDFATVADVAGTRFPDPRPGALAKVARTLFGDDGHPDVTVVACPLPRLGRVTLSGADHPLADLVAASSAVPAVLAPHRVGGRLHVDAGVRSAVSADLAPAADLLVVVAPMAGQAMGVQGRQVRRTTAAETARWERHHGGTTVVAVPDRNVGRGAQWPHRLFDRALAAGAYDAGTTDGLALAGRLGDTATSSPLAAAR